MKIAFCTTDGTLIDEHFGRCEQMAIYDITPAGYHFEEMRSMEVIDPSGPHGSHIESKASSIADCAIVYMTEIGGPAAAVVVRNRIHPVKVPKPQPIEEVLESLQHTLQNSPPPWLKKIMHS
ncbi:nitrogen fixation protein NifX [Desulfurispira natronophila]|uniref:Nitrogen fixation protein NifX n=1 Tax=Desulfurispira natronophila TaxID=682562 RepID=A0A7W7Y3X8_9BACT|nr:nitrogen fixation protein NifX [Desulfurispira natronophila]MBB5021607.1 nitrogen fixation protein NifX [Desulfurispira natronophila]